MDLVTGGRGHLKQNHYSAARRPDTDWSGEGTVSNLPNKIK